jgi:four helix bundle protein
MEESKNTIKSFQDLEAWKACRIVLRTIRTEILPRIPAKDFDMKDNINRAARSTTRNLAEGYGRFTFKDNAHFVKISRGSLHEIEDDLITIFEEGHLDKNTFENINSQVATAIRIVNGYLRYLNSQNIKN